jgi:hypothetical protein
MNAMLHVFNFDNLDLIIIEIQLLVISKWKLYINPKLNLCILQTGFYDFLFMIIYLSQIIYD